MRAHVVEMLTLVSISWTWFRNQPRTSTALGRGSARRPKAEHAGGGQQEKIAESVMSVVEVVKKSS